jgi:carboxyl-terminal processing protease
VLQNENSASASEILAGAIQDNDRGLSWDVVPSKGLVQREMDFDDGSAVRLTVADIIRQGRSIQKPYLGNEEYFNESEKRFDSGELYEKDSIKVADSLKFKTPKGKLFMVEVVLFQIFCSSRVEHGNENTVYDEIRCGKFCFRAIRQKIE